MTFKYVPQFKGEFVDGDQKDALIASNEPFEISAIRFSEKGKFGPQFYLTVKFLDETDGIMTFTADGTVFTRDDLLDQAMQFLKANKGQTLIARLSKEGQTTLVTIEED